MDLTDGERRVVMMLAEAVATLKLEGKIEDKRLRALAAAIQEQPGGVGTLFEGFTTNSTDDQRAGPMIVNRQ